VGVVKAFFRKLGSFLTFLRVWTVNLLTLAVLVYAVVLVATILREGPRAVDPEGKVLILAPDGIVLDQQTFPADLSFPFPDIPDEDQIHTRDLIRVIRAAAGDERLAGVLIDFSEARFVGPSTALLLAEELAALGAAGRPLIAFSDGFTTSSYLMAAQADEIYVHPSGAVAISGIGGYRDYTRELTDKLRITMHNYSQGDFKSAVESRTRTDMSDADRLQRTELYRPLWASLKNLMAQRRGLDPEVFQDLADNHSVPLIEEAAYDNLARSRELGIIDGVKSFPEFRAYMIERFGRDEDAEKHTYPHIGADAYLARLETENPKTEDAVAVVFVQGVIQTGKQGPGVAGSDDIAGLLRRAHEDESTRALVVRVNSPGGSIIASDIIRDELAAAAGKDIPVLVSMGDVAASGGMWVSTPAEAIYAEPTTVTGSIGVAVAFPTLENAFDHIGVNFDGVTTSEHAGWNLSRPVDEELDAIFARWAGNAYERFIDIVADSREREPDYIRSVAGGRVWTGERARELGLIDALGTMEDTIEAAAARAGLEEYRVNYVVKEIPPGYALLRRFAANVPDSHYGEFGRRMARLMALFEGIGRPTAAVMCTVCMVEMP